MNEPYVDHLDGSPTYIKSVQTNVHEDTGLSSPTDQYEEMEPCKEMFLEEFAKSPTEANMYNIEGLNKDQIYRIGLNDQ